jgi:hypothetical protein
MIVAELDPTILAQKIWAVTSSPNLLYRFVMVIESMILFLGFGMQK